VHLLVAALAVGLGAVPVVAWVLERVLALYRQCKQWKRRKRWHRHTHVHSYAIAQTNQLPTFQTYPHAARGTYLRQVRT